MAGEAVEYAGVHGQVVPLRQRARAARGQHRDLDRGAEHGRSAFGRVGRADDQATPGTLVAHGRHRLGRGSWAAAISAAIFGVAALASFDQPPVSRMLTKRIGRSCSPGAPAVCSASRGTGGFPGCRRRAGPRPTWPRAGRPAPRAGTSCCGRCRGPQSPRPAPGAAPGPAPWRPAASSGCSRRSASSCGAAVSPTPGAPSAARVRVDPAPRVRRPAARTRGRAGSDAAAPAANARFRRRPRRARRARRRC